MTIRLRLALQGRRNYRIFHLVAIDQRKARDAKPAELLGIYDPNLKPGETVKTIQWSVERIRYWLHVGAQPSKRFVKLLELGGVLQEGHPYNSGSPEHNFLPPSQASSSSAPEVEAKAISA
ncbi:ribosomal protein S16 domain-containing protein [Cyathus striatus]|nr:ribosomal protein S16 domain-containing protein [Cyathus striatus]